jgi:hypothetical protein
MTDTKPTPADILIAIAKAEALDRSRMAARSRTFWRAQTCVVAR